MAMMGAGMKKDLFLKELAQSGYNIGYAAKKHLATFDIVEKAPGWITVATLAIGIFALVLPSLEHHLIAALVIVVGVASMYFGSYQDSRGSYEKTGSRLTTLFTELRMLYAEAQSLDDNADLEGLKTRYRAVLEESQRIGISKQIFLSDWYAHYKFFWQAQTGWLDEQLHFGFWRDKVPLSATVIACVMVIAGLFAAVSALVIHFGACP